MAIRDGLVLDHLYVSIPEDDFDSLASVLASHSGIDRKVVNAGDASWEGIYAHHRIGSYFEFLRGRRDGGFGIAISAARQHTMDARKIVGDLPDLQWQKGTRYRLNNEPWFDWLSLGDYLHHETTMFNAWIMFYHQIHLVPERARLTPSLDSLSKIELIAGMSVREEITRNGIWLPGTRRVDDPSGLVLVLPDRDSSPVEVRIAFEEERSGFTLRSLTWWRARGASWVEKTLGPWRLGVDHDQITLACEP